MSTETSKLYSLRELHKKHVIETGHEYTDAVTHCIDFSVNDRIEWIKRLNWALHIISFILWVSLYLSLMFYTSFMRLNMLSNTACSLTVGYIIHVMMPRYVKKCLCETMHERSVNFGYNQYDAIYVSLLPMQDVARIAVPRDTADMVGQYIESSSAGNPVIINGELPWRHVAYGIQLGAVEFILNKALRRHLLTPTSGAILYTGK